MATVRLDYTSRVVDTQIMPKKKEETYEALVNTLNETMGDTIDFK